MAIDELVAAMFTGEVQPTMSPTAVSATTPKQVIQRAKELGVKMVDFRFTDLPGTWQHFSVPVGELTELRLRATASASTGRASAASRRSTRATCSSSRTPRAPSSTRARGAHAGRRLRHRRPADAQAVQPRPALRGAQGGGVPAPVGHRRDVVLGPGGRVLHLQLHPVRPEHPRGLLLHRLRRGRLEHRQERHRQPRLPAQAEERLLPGATGRQAAGPAQPHRAGA